MLQDFYLHDFNVDDIPCGIFTNYKCPNFCKKQDLIMMKERHIHKTKLYIVTSLAANVKTTFSYIL